MTEREEKEKPDIMLVGQKAGQCQASCPYKLLFQMRLLTKQLLLSSCFYNFLVVVIGGE